MTAASCDAKSDITFTAFAGASRPAWTDSEKRRLCDADKLAGHLSEGRVAREGNYPEWGSPSDLTLLRDHVLDLLGRTSGPPDLLPHSRRAWVRL